MENLHKHENSKDSETTVGIYDIWGKREKVGENRVLGFRRENKQFAEVEEERDTDRQTLGG